MTIASAVATAGPYTTNGSSAGPYSFSFKIQAYSTSSAADHVEVTIEDADGSNRTTLTLTTDYTVSVNSDQSASPGGSVTLVSTPASGRIVRIALVPPFKQATSLANQAAYRADTVMAEFDHQAQTDFWLKSRVDRSIRFPVGETVTTDLPSSATRKGKVLTFDSSTGQPSVRSSIQAEGSLIPDEVIYTASASQTVFSIPGQVITDRELLDVWIGGAIQTKDDFSLSNNGTDTTLTMDSGVSAGTEVIIKVRGSQYITSLALSVDQPSILHYIPSTKHAGIAARTNTDDLTSYFEDFFAAGGGTIPAGRYWINPVSITNEVFVRMINAEIYQKSAGSVAGTAYNAATNSVITRQALWSFDTGSEGSTVTGEGDCWFDGYTGILSQTGTHKASFVNEYDSRWGAIDAFAERVSIEGVNFRNFLTFPVTLEGDGQTWKRARIEKCGQGGHAGPFKAPTSALTGLPVGGVIGQTVEDITLSEIGNDGYDVFQHAFDVSYSHFSRIQGQERLADETLAFLYVGSSFFIEAERWLAGH
jgi:hypothetical protein